MKFLAILLLFNFGIFCYGYNPNRIWNGTVASIKTYANVPRLLSFAVKLKDVADDVGYPKMGISLCTGSIISPRHYLTAAHCVGTIYQNNKNPEEFHLMPHQGFLIDYDKLDNISSLHIKENGLVTTVYPHPGWKSLRFTERDDIAIIEFPIGTNLNITPVKLAKEYDERDGDYGYSVGYGDTDPDPKKFGVTQELMELKTPIIKDCAWKDINTKIICAGTKTARVDHGDSGGPLFFKDDDDVLFQVAVAHGGTYANGSSADGDADFASFNRISDYCDWIQETTKNEASCQEMKRKPLPPPPQPSIVPTPAAINNDGISYNTVFPILSLLLTFIIVV